MFTILKTKISPSFLERFDLFDLERRREFLLPFDNFIFKINEDIRELEKLHNYFPDAKVIVLIRHPLEVIHSIYKPNEKSIPFRPFVDIKEKWAHPEDSSYLSAVIRRFESYYPTSVLNFVKDSPSWLKVVKYEDYLKSFDENIKNTFQFIEIRDYTKTMLVGPQKTPNQAVRFSNFTEDEQKTNQ